MNIWENNLTIPEDSILTKKTEEGKIAIQEKNVYYAVKRGIDIVGALVGILLLIPITIAISIHKIIKKEKSSIFFIQERIGKDGKLFKIYKYRTMVENADEVLKRYLQEDEEMAREYKIHKKLKEDPRITKLGHFLRKTSLDEFPQFLNVLKGEMSLVGPRPYLEREKEEMGQAYYDIIKDKPGLTGLWQVSGRSNLTFENRLNLDQKYEKEKSLKLDMKLLLKTVLKTANKEGAI